MKTPFLYVLAGVAVVLLGITTVILPGTTNAPAEVSEGTIETSIAIEDIVPPQRLPVPSGTNALQQLSLTAASLTTKEYVGLGTMVEGIGQQSNGTDGKYWQYFINGKIAPVGADSYVLQEGDAIEWKFLVPDFSL